jgi:HEAT repeat protein
LDSFLLLLGHRLAASGSKDQVVEALTKSFEGEELASTATATNVRIGAARLLCEIQGEGAINTLLPVVEKGNTQFRAGVLDAIAKIPGDNVTQALVGRLKAVGAADLKVEFLHALAKRKDAAARPAVIDASKNDDANVSSAAIEALVSLGRDEAIAPLVAMVVAGGAEAKTAAETLARMPGDKALGAAAEALGSASAKGKTALLELLAVRGATAQKEAVLKETSDADGSVRQAAFKAMEKVGSEGDAARLIELAVAAKDDADASAALKAAAACAAHGEDADQRSAAFVAALANVKGPRRAALERAVAKVGGSKALVIVVEDLKSNDKAVRQGALEALSEWQGAEAVPALLDAAQSGDADQQVTAIRGAVRVLSAAKSMPAGEKAAAYGKALSAAKRPEEKKMILGALGAERGQAYFDLAASMLDEGGLKAEASLAVIKTALPEQKGKGGLKGPKVAEALQKAIPDCPDGGLKADAERYLKTLQKK